MEDIEATKTRIKEIDEILQDDYKEHLESLFRCEAPFMADFEHWTNNNCLSFDDWYLEEADADLYEELEALRSILYIDYIEDD